MDAFFQKAILDALIEQDWPKLIGYGAIFFLIWREVRGLRSEFTTLNHFMQARFVDGEKRFDRIDIRLNDLDGKGSTKSEEQELIGKPEGVII